MWGRRGRWTFPGLGLTGSCRAGRKGRGQEEEEEAEVQGEEGEAEGEEGGMQREGAEEAEVCS